MATSKSKLTNSHLFLLVADIFLLVFYLLKEGMPSLNNNVIGIMKFIVELFVLILVIGFTFYFLFAESGAKATYRSFAPAILIFIVVGTYSLSFGGNSDVNAVLSSIAQMFYLLILVCGFVYLFFPKKVFGMVFSFSSLIFAVFVTLSYTITAIMFAVDGGEFSVSKLFETLCYVFALCFLWLGSYYLNKNKTLVS